MPVPTAPRWLSAIRKRVPSKPAVSGVHSIELIRARGGASADSASSNAASAAACLKACI